MKIIAITNQKGGTAKTTTAAALNAQQLADCIAHLEKLHLIDEIPTPSGPGYRPPMPLREYFIQRMNAGQRRDVHKAILKEMETRTQSVVLPLNPMETIIVPNVQPPRPSARFYYDTQVAAVLTASHYADLDALEERLFHLIQGGEAGKAYYIFLDELYNQAIQLRQFQRVTRIVPLA